ncbi:unnamed protein product [Colias eurytheme]|nr:unnamed protein product [Colias eurytheme]
MIWEFTKTRAAGQNCVDCRLAQTLNKEVPAWEMIMWYTALSRHQITLLIQINHKCSSTRRVNITNSKYIRLNGRTRSAGAASIALAPPRPPRCNATDGIPPRFLTKASASTMQVPPPPPLHRRRTPPLDSRLAHKETGSNRNVL